MSNPTLDYGNTQTENLVNINQIRFSNLGGNPETLGAGSIYFNINAHHAYLDTVGNGSFNVIPMGGDSISTFGAPTDDFDFDGAHLTGLADPVNPQDAATKNFVGTSITTAGAGYYANTVPLNSITSPIGSVNMNTQLVTSVADPVSVQDAMTLNYADNNYAPISSWGGTNLTARVVGGQSITGFTYVQLSDTGTFTGMGSNNFTINADGSLTYTGTATINVLFSATVTVAVATTANNEFYIQFYKNGAGISNPAISQVDIVALATDVQLVLNNIISVSTNDIISLWATLGTSDVLNNDVMTIIARTI